MVPPFSAIPQPPHASDFVSVSPKSLQGFFVARTVELSGRWPCVGGRSPGLNASNSITVPRSRQRTRTGHRCRVPDRQLELLYVYVQMNRQACVAKPCRECCLVLPSPVALVGLPSDPGKISRSLPGSCVMCYRASTAMGELSSLC